MIDDLLNRMELTKVKGDVFQHDRLNVLFGNLD